MLEEAFFFCKVVGWMRKRAMTTRVDPSRLLPVGPPVSLFTGGKRSGLLTMSIAKGIETRASSPSLW